MHLNLLCSFTSQNVSYNMALDVLRPFRMVKFCFSRAPWYDRQIQSNQMKQKKPPPVVFPIVPVLKYSNLQNFHREWKQLMKPLWNMSHLVLLLDAPWQELLLLLHGLSFFREKTNVRKKQSFLRSLLILWMYSVVSCISANNSLAFPSCLHATASSRNLDLPKTSEQNVELLLLGAKIANMKYENYDGGGGGERPTWALWPTKHPPPCHLRTTSASVIGSSPAQVQELGAGHPQCSTMISPGPAQANKRTG